MLKLKTSNRELSKNEKIILIILCVIAIVFIVNALIITPLDKKLKPLKDEIQVLEEQVNNLETINFDIEKNKKELEKLQIEYDEASKTMPKTDRYPNVIRDLEAMAVKSNVEITNEVLEKPKVVQDEQNNNENNEEKNEENKTDITQGLSSFMVNLTVKGSYNDMLKFIDKLENDSRILEISNFKSNDKISNLTLIYYVAGGIEKEEYDFNSEKYGKGNIFG